MNKKTMLLTIIGLSTVILLITAGTFAFFISSMNNDSKNITVGTATVSNVQLTNEMIGMSDILPGYESESHNITASATITGEFTVPYTCTISQSSESLVDLEYYVTAGSGMSSTNNQQWTKITTTSTEFLTGSLSQSSLSQTSAIKFRLHETGTNQTSGQSGVNSTVIITCTLDGGGSLYYNNNSSGSGTIISPGDSDSSSGYKEASLHGTDPVLETGLIPVIITQGGSDYVVTKADTNEKWYNYEASEWANAVKLVSSPSKAYSTGDIIDHEDIDGFFVWIPKYRYKIFDMGSYTEFTNVETKNQLIEIEFGTTNSTDVLTGTKQTCATPMTSGGSGYCAVDRWMTHPAFLSLDVNGIWVGKFETTGTTSNGSITSMTVKPNERSITMVNIYNMFTKALTYDTSLNSHMMKNTEWGAVAYLSHSIYGIGNTNIYKNNYYDSSTLYQTGCVAPGPDTAKSTTCTYKWYETNGFNGSTTGNITGIYDMSGGQWEYMAAYRNNTPGNSSGFTAATIAQYDTKYFDIYDGASTVSSFDKRILGDATGELGPFQTSGVYGQRSSWYNTYAYFVSSEWFGRGGSAYETSSFGITSFNKSTGQSYNGYGFRLVLAP